MGIALLILGSPGSGEVTNGEPKGGSQIVLFSTTEDGLLASVARPAQLPNAFVWHYTWTVPGSVSGFLVLAVFSILCFRTAQAYCQSKKTCSMTHWSVSAMGSLAKMPPPVLKFLLNSAFWCKSVLVIEIYTKYVVPPCSMENVQKLFRCHPTGDSSAASHRCCRLHRCSLLHSATSSFSLVTYWTYSPQDAEK